jgi:glucose/arabinose dehydrogenase
MNSAVQPSHHVSRGLLSLPVACALSLPVACALATILFVSPGAAATSPGTGGPGAHRFLGDAATASAPTQSTAVLAAGFQDNVVISGLTNPTAIRFSPDGRVFVAEKSGLLKVFDSLSAATPTVVADLRTEVDNYWDRGLLGLALDPGFPTVPYVYLLYTYDGGPGQTAPVWNDACSTPPGPTTDGCVVTGKLVRLQLSGNSVVDRTTLIGGEWCQQFPSHSIGNLGFGPDGKLYVSGGEGASFTGVDYGQYGGSSGSPTPKNPCGDPPAGVGGTESPPTAEGGALRSQSVRRAAGEPVVLNGALLRVDPTTGAAAADNPLAASTSANARRIIAYGMRNPFRFTFRPGTNEVWVGDVGWNNWEELDRVPNPTASPLNFGWPCYEGNSPQAGYQSANLDLCNSLYAAGTASAPYYTYSHSASVVSGDNCPTANGSVVSALSFYSSGSYPSSYNGALFFGDHSRNCIWAMLPSTNGVPDPSKITLIESAASNPVDIEPGPNGDLYYVDFDGGTIRKISYSATQNQTCTAGTWDAQYFNNTTLSGAPVLEQCEQAINYNWGTGSPAPGVSVDNFSVRWSGQFTFPGGSTTFTATTDDGVRLYLDGNRVIDQWKDQSATTVTASVPVSAGSHTVTVEYYEHQATAVAQVHWMSCDTGTWEAQYFNNTALAGPPVLEQCEQAINYNWGTGSPAPAVTVDNFSVRWSGQFSFPGGSTTFTATTDDGVRLYLDGNLVIDRWIDQSTTTITATTQVTAGMHMVKVEYYDHQATAVARVNWTTTGSNAPPTPVIDTPPPTLTYAVGDAISFSGHATDTEDGTVAASGLSWTLIQHHCTTQTTCHTHLVQTWSGVASGSFNAPDHDYPSYLELQLTATDSGGLSSTTSVNLHPKTVDLTFNSSPSGLSLVVGSSASTTPFTRTVIINSSNSISATTPQTLNGTTYAFVSWSDSGAATHNILAPATATTYTATYGNGQPPVNTTAPSLSGPTREGRTLSTSDGSWSGTTPMGFAYAWRRCDSSGSCTTISGATSSSYTLVAADVGFKIQSRVTATNTAGSASADSAPSAVIKRGH